MWNAFGVFSSFHLPDVLSENPNYPVYPSMFQQLLSQQQSIVAPSLLLEFFLTCLNIIKMHSVVLSKWETVMPLRLRGMGWDARSSREMKINGKKLQCGGANGNIISLLQSHDWLGEEGDKSSLSRYVGYLCSSLGCTNAKDLLLSRRGDLGSPVLLVNECFWKQGLGCGGSICTFPTHRHTHLKIMFLPLEWVFLKGQL